jgi:hypothetical protein
MTILTGFVGLCEGSVGGGVGAGVGLAGIIAEVIPGVLIFSAALGIAFFRWQFRWWTPPPAGHGEIVQ